MSTILVVDDEEDMQPVFLGKFRSKIQQGVYQFRFATNGRVALEKIRQETDIDLVLLDINMPELDGLSVLAQIPSLNPFLGTVIVSAYNDMGNIRQAMNRGRSIVSANQLILQIWNSPPKKRCIIYGNCAKQII